MPEKGRTAPTGPGVKTTLVTTRPTGESLVRVVLPRDPAGKQAECEAMIDQSRAYRSTAQTPQGSFEVFAIAVLEIGPVKDIPPSALHLADPGGRKRADPRREVARATT